MRAQCIICQELFENEDEVISAISCGHTFHSHCLNQWLENSRTCPSCRVNVDRRKIIERLYFDCPEDKDDVVDDGKLKNEIDRLKLEVRKKNKEKNDIVKEKETQANRIVELQKANDALARSVKEEQTKNSAHIKTLKYYQSQQKSIDLEREECKKTKQKLVTLQSLEVLLNGTETEVSDVLSSVGEGSNSVLHLTKQMVFLKREYEKIKIEKHHMKDNYDKIQLQDNVRKKKIHDLTEENRQLRDQLERSEGDLKIAEREIEFIRRSNSKLKAKLQQSLSSGSSDSGSSSFNNIMNESAKMSAFSASTPKLGEPCCSQMVDLDITPDLFASPVKSDILPSQNLNTQASCDENSLDRISKSQKRRLDPEDVENQSQMKYLKITSAAGKKMKPSNTMRDVNSVAALATMNIFRKKDPGERTTKNSIVQKGFDGLGGHTTFVNARGNPFKKPIKLKKTSAKSTSVPSLPKLDHFVMLD